MKRRVCFEICYSKIENGLTYGMKPTTNIFELVINAVEPFEEGFRSLFTNTVDSILMSIQYKHR